MESEEAPALTPYLVITGDPGSGKSTLMAHLALCMAGDMLTEVERSRADLTHLGFWPHPAYTPVYIELRTLVRSTFPSLDDEITIRKLLEYLDQEQLAPNGLSHYLDDLRDQMRDGDVMFFLDGLDEIPDAQEPKRREQLKQLAQLLRMQYPKCRILITARSYAYAGDWHLEGFGQVRLSWLEPDRLEELALRLFRVVLGQEGAEQEAGLFKQQMERVPANLRRTPLFFTLMAAIWLNRTTRPVAQRLPVTLEAIYRECVDMLIQRWTRKDLQYGESMVERMGLNEKQLRQVLELLAYTVHSEHGSKDDTVFESGQIMTLCRKRGLKDVKYDIFLEMLAQRAGIVHERAPEEYCFTHRSFQEHLAACYLANDEHWPQLTLQNLNHDPVLWRNVMELLPDEATRQKRDLWKVVSNLLPDNAMNGKNTNMTVDDPVWLRIFYAARLIMKLLPASDDLQQIYRPRLFEALVNLITIGALSPIDRAEMARYLDDLGDPRPGIGLRSDGLPDIVWCEVPAGEFIMGSEKVNDNPIHQLTLPRFFISKYPITYRQYQAFIDAPDGYMNATWWDVELNEGSHHQLFQYGNHPRETVNWYEAIAFCRWLSTRLGTDVTLPTEQQWEKAARGMDGRLYPYGNDFDANKGNTAETGIEQTCAVGIFPDGVSPYGVMDMSGNVWEWTLPQNKSLGSENDRCVARGGCWNGTQDFSRASCCYRGFPLDAQSYNLGFRVCCTSGSKTSVVEGQQ